MSGIVEIAERAGVSPATVSRALRGLHHVNERTRSKIVTAAMELNYPLRPDLLPASAKIFLHFGDLSDPSSMIKILGETQPDEIYNLAEIGRAHV